MKKKILIGITSLIILVTLSGCGKEKIRYTQEKTIKKEPLFAKKRLLVFQATKAYYFTFATIALNASGWFMAKSANTLRLISIPAACKAPIKRE